MKLLTRSTLLEVIDLMLEMKRPHSGRPHPLRILVSGINRGMVGEYHMALGDRGYNLTFDEIYSVALLAMQIGGKRG